MGVLGGRCFGVGHNDLRLFIAHLLHFSMVMSDCFARTHTHELFLCCDFLFSPRGVGRLRGGGFSGWGIMMLVCLSSTATTLRHPRMVLLATMPLNQNLPEVENQLRRIGKLGKMSPE